jgi:hypothetical protein
MLWEKPSVCFGLVIEWANAPEWTTCSRITFVWGGNLTILWVCVYEEVYLCYPSVLH